MIKYHLNIPPRIWGIYKSHCPSFCMSGFFVSGLWLCTTWMDFHINWQKCLTYLDSVSHKRITQRLKVTLAYWMLKCNYLFQSNCFMHGKILILNYDFVFSLLPVLSEESLQNNMEAESDGNIVIHALQLFKALLKSNEVVSSLCPNTTGKLIKYHDFLLVSDHSGFM